MDCLFCKIAKKEIPATIIYEDETVIAFLDVHPINEGHMLVIPRNHSDDLFGIPYDDLLQSMVIVKKIAIAIKKVLQCEGINIGINNGVAAGQKVPHVHIHVIPRYENDGLSHWPRKEYLQGILQDVGERIKRGF